MRQRETMKRCGSSQQSNASAFDSGTLMVPGVGFGALVRTYTPGVVGMLNDLGYTAVLVPEPTTLAAVALGVSTPVIRRRRATA